MSNTNNTMQTQTSNTLHNAIMEAGGKDRPPICTIYLEVNNIFGGNYDTSNTQVNQGHEEHIDDPTLESSVCKIRRFKMMKCSFNADEEYIAIKESEYLNHLKENLDAFRELLRIIDEGWVMATPDEEGRGKKKDLTIRKSMIWNTPKSVVGDKVSTASAATTVSAATTTTVTITTVGDITLAQALEEIKKPVIEPVKPMKRKDQIRLDEEATLKLQAAFDEEERLAR
nr:hypothetical protein [Tanacetum cinerariifolium]